MLYRRFDQEARPLGTRIACPAKAAAIHQKEDPMPDEAKPVGVRLEISRRTFVQGALVGGLSAVAAEQLWVKPAGAKQVSGGHLRLAIAGGSTTDSLDPRTYAETFMIMMGYALRGNLIEVAADGSAKPELAESIEPLKGGAEWLVKLRKGIEFSNGKTLTAEDVIKSINLHRKEDSTSGAKPILATITDIKADNNDSILFTLSAGDADFPYVLADYHLSIMPFKGEDFDVNVGCGPFTIKEFSPGRQAILERNKTSYKTAFIDSAEVISVGDPTARQSALVSGQVDLISRPDLRTAKRLSATAGVRVVDVVGRTYYSLIGDTRFKPFDNQDFCLAMKYAIDRRSIVDKVLYGHGEIGNDSPITPSYKYFATDLKPRPYDLDKARFHLNKSGVQGGRLDLSTSDAVFSGAVDAATLFADSMAKIGVSVNVIREPTDAYWDNVWLKKPFCMAFWGGRPTEDGILTSAYYSKAPWNESRWNNKRFDDLLIAARAELDEAKRRNMYAELQHLVADECSVLIPVFANNVHAASVKVITPERISGVRELDGARFLERWSLAS
jgi:peptide/nickel transport system substrate-binding protein